MNKRGLYQPPACPVCGESVISLRPRSLGEFLKIIFALGLFAYAVLGTFLGMVSIAAEHPSQKEAIFLFGWMQPYTHQPIFQIFIVGGYAAGFLLFYLDWFESLTENWRKKRAKDEGEPPPQHKYTCRYCGHQWD